MDTKVDTVFDQMKLELEKIKQELVKVIEEKRIKFRVRMKEYILPKIEAKRSEWLSFLSLFEIDLPPLAVTTDNIFHIITNLILKLFGLFCKKLKKGNAKQVLAVIDEVIKKTADYALNIYDDLKFQFILLP